MIKRLSVVATLATAAVAAVAVAVDTTLFAAAVILLSIMLTNINITA